MRIIKWRFEGCDPNDMYCAMRLLATTADHNHRRGVSPRGSLIPDAGRAAPFEWRIFGRDFLREFAARLAALESWIDWGAP